MHIIILVELERLLTDCMYFLIDWVGNERKEQTALTYCDIVPQGREEEMLKG